MGKQRMRVLLAKVGLDGHDRGIMVVAQALKEAGVEVIYLGRHQRPEQIVQAAIQEDVDVVGISSLADAHTVLVPKIVDGLKKGGRGDIPVVLGGFIQPEDIPLLKEIGIKEVFGIGTKLDTIASCLQKICIK